MKFASKIRRLERALKVASPYAITATVCDGRVYSMILSTGEVVDGRGRTPAECGLDTQRPPPAITRVQGLDLDIVIGLVDLRTQGLDGWLSQGRTRSTAGAGLGAY